MAILLKDIWSIDNLTDYKIHFARVNENKTQPLDAWILDRQKWQGWQETRKGRDDFNRQFIFSLMQFYHEKDIWLFGGVFEVLGRPEGRYEVQLTDQGKEYIGRLKIRSSYRGRPTRKKMEVHYNEFKVQEILREPYTAGEFPGYDKINLSFKELAFLISNNRQDWKTALETIKGVYLITDIKKKKRYVGSASGVGGIWSRWENYMRTGDCGNRGIRAHVNNVKRDNQTRMDYCREAFRFTLLEQCLTSTPKDKIIERETFWKDILLTKEKQGLNRN